MAEISDSGAPGRRLVLTEILLLIVLSVSLLLFLIYCVRVLVFPYPVDYGEGPLLDQVVRLSRFESIYRLDLTTPPFTISNYPPLYMVAQVPFRWLFGPAFWYGRLISFASIAVSAVFIVLITRTLTRDWLAGVIGGLIFVTIPYVSFWAPLFRVDSLALALSLGALFVIVRWPDDRRALGGTAILLTAAVYTRQSYGLAGPLAAFLWLLAHKPRRRAFVLSALVLGLGVVFFGLLSLLTRGGFYFNIVTANVNKFRVDQLTDWLAKIWHAMPLLLVGNGLFLLLGGWFRVRSWRLVGPYLFGAALAALTIGKAGAWVNYWLEFSAATGLVAGAFIAWQRKRPWVRHAFALALIFQVVWLWPIRPASEEAAYHRSVEAKLDRRIEMDQLMGVVREADGLVLADEYMGLLPLDGRDLYIQPFEMTELARAGVWDETPFLAAIDRKEFSAILIYAPPAYPLHRERWTPEALHRIETQYVVVDDVYGTLVYVP